MVLAYVVIGAVMFGGGAVDASEMGMASKFINTDEDFGPTRGDDTPSHEMTSAIGSADDYAAMLTGTILLAANMITVVVVYLNWPIVVLLQNGAPPTAIAVMGVPFTAAFYMSILSAVR